MTSLPIKGLDFNEIKSNFIDFLKNEGSYTDFNFDGSGVNSLVNILAFNAHYIGFYVKMLLNESFLDSAQKRDSLLSKAKLNGYVPKNKRSARATMQLKITMDPEQEPETTALIIPKDSYFIGKNTLADERAFYLLDSVTCYDREQVGSDIVYTSPEFTVYEGSLREWRFKVNSSVTNQRFIIKDKKIDIDTIRMIVFEDDTEVDGTAFQLASSIDDLEADSNSFFINTNENGFYELFFGNDLLGKQPEHNNIVYITYLSSNGTAGNGCKTFEYQKPSESVPGNLTTGSFDDFETVMVDVASSGGMEEESLESIRFNIPNHHRMQKRLVTANDFRDILMSEFRDIDSISVWGGEDNLFKNFGAIYIAIKPLNSNSLSDFSKKEVESIVQKYSIVGTRVIIEDPEFIDVDLTFFFKFDNKITNKSVGELISIITQKTREFNTLYLNTFGTGLSDFDLLKYIKDAEPSITQIYDKKIIKKEKTVLYDSSEENIIYFSNEIVPGKVFSDPFTYGTLTVKIVDDGLGKLWVVDMNGVRRIVTSIGTVDYTTGLLKFKTEFDLVTSTDNNGISGTLVFTVYPEKPNIDTYLNNIVKINSIQVYNS
jgi:hypothetical protein